MTNQRGQEREQTQREQKSANYDRHIVSAETAARQDREKENYKELPENEDSNELDTTGGYTVDREGLLNNYPVEPEMYVNVPGDMQEKQEEEAIERAQELDEINHEGGKGPGLV